jgi:hypothetical protein
VPETTVCPLSHNEAVTDVYLHSSTGMAGRAVRVEMSLFLQRLTNI